MGRYGRPVRCLCAADIHRRGVVHWYAHPPPILLANAESPHASETESHRRGLRLTRAVAYSLGIYLLNLFLAFLSPKFDPSLEQDEGMEDGTAGGLPTKADDEFRPFVRRLPEFKFWYSTTKAITIGFLCSWFEVFNLPVFWPVLVVYWLILFGLTSTSPPSQCTPLLI
jgi:hypothetical protein